MTLEIRKGKLPNVLIGVVQAEYNEEKGTAVIDVSNLVETHVLEPYASSHRCEDLRHGVRLERYFEAKDVKRCGSPDYFAPRLEGTLLGQDGSADFVLYF